MELFAMGRQHFSSVRQTTGVCLTSHVSFMMQSINVRLGQLSPVKCSLDLTRCIWTWHGSTFNENLLQYSEVLFLCPQKEKWILCNI